MEKSYYGTFLILILDVIFDMLCCRKACPTLHKGWLFIYMYFFRFVWSAKSLGSPRPIYMETSYGSSWGFAGSAEHAGTSCFAERKYGGDTQIVGAKLCRPTSTA